MRYYKNHFVASLFQSPVCGADDLRAVADHKRRFRQY
jgi:hypothetical protein